jgi:hypothetical protein
MLTLDRSARRSTPRALLGRAGRGKLARGAGGPVAVEALESRQLLSIAASWPLPMDWTGSTVEMFRPSGTSMQTLDAVSDALIDADLFRADPRFSGVTGQGYAAVVLDTGIDRDHAFFGPDGNGNGIADRIVYSYDFADNDADASDRNGHGSNVTSIVGSSNATHRGMAPGVNLIHLKVFKDSGAGSFAYTEAALRWVVANVQNYNIVSVNMSLGDTRNWATHQQLYGISDEIATLAAQNVMVVAASGNDFARFNSTRGMAYPAADPNVIAVGAVYDRNFGGGITYASGARADATGPDRITPFSQRSTTMYQVFAPGAPITGASHTGGTVTQHGTSQAAPHVAGVAVLAQQLADSVLGRRLSLAEMRSLLTSTGDTIVDGDDEADNVVNTGASFKRVNVRALADAIYEMGGPSARVRLGAAGVASGGAAVNFGAVNVGAPVSRTFTVDNPGSESLVLSDLSAPAGFRITSGFGATTLAPGQSTTFTVRFDASNPGPATGSVTFSTNIETRPTFSINVSASATGFASFLDDGSPGFTLAGTWGTSVSGFGSDMRWKAAGTGLGTATWAFNNLLPGQYRVSATWRAGATLATNAAYTFLDGAGATLGSATISQRTAPNDRLANTVWWEDLGTVSLSSTVLRVRLSDLNAGGPLIADAVRIERVGNLPGGPEVFVSTAAGTVTSLLSDNTGTLNLGSAASGVALARTFTVRNVGDADLTLSGPITLPSGYTLQTAPDSSVIAPGSSTSFTVRVNPGVAGTYAGTIGIGTDDADESTFRVNVTATVTPVVRALNDGQTGVGVAGVWTIGSAGLTGHRFKAAGTGTGHVQYVFTGLTPGQYRVSLTWPGSATPNTLLSSQTTVRMFNGATALTPVTVDQQTAPTDRNAHNLWWDDLGTFNITGAAMTVRITDLANGRVLADAVRIERVGNLA